MLEKDRLESCFDLSVFFLNSEHSQDVAVVCFDEMFLNGVFIELAVVDKGVFGLDVGCIDSNDEEGQQYGGNYWEMVLSHQ